jgi:uncharacterized protein (TIGR02271 family)
MAKTVIGLVDDPRQAQHIIQALVDEGFRREDIRTLTRQEEASVGTLSACGVPEAEAQGYAESLRRGGVVVLVDAADERADRAVAIMERDPAMDLEAQKGAEAARGRGRAGTRAVETGEIKVPVVEETLQVGTRQVRRGGVRLYTRVTERPVEETVRLRDETVHVERRPMDRPATEADFAAAHERTVEVTETDEEPVVRRQARVVEEVVVSKAVEEQAETVRDTVRRTEVEVEPLGAEHPRVIATAMSSPASDAMPAATGRRSNQRPGATGRPVTRAHGRSSKTRFATPGTACAAGARWDDRRHAHDQR